MAQGGDAALMEVNIEAIFCVARARCCPLPIRTTLGLNSAQREHIMNISIVEAAMMDGSLQGSVRDARGRFVPGQSGNPDGKLPGTRNRATLLKAALDSEDGPAMARIVIDKALAGDVVTARFCIDRLEPRPRGRAIAIDLPEGARASDVVAAFDATLRAMAVGEITPDEAVQVTRVLDGRRKAIEAARREREAEIKPSPLGRGLGEGVRPTLGDNRAASGSPDPLPRGEGMSRRMAEGGALASSIPRLPVAGAIGASRANLLHSTCLSSLSRVMEWAARGRSGAGSATGVA
jgi:hypothetical protein